MVFMLMGLTLAVPDFTTLPRRMPGMHIVAPCATGGNRSTWKIHFSGSIPPGTYPNHLTKNSRHVSNVL